MTELLTWSEITSKFNAEWVLVEDPEVDDDLQLVRGRVVFHSRDRKALDDAMLSHQIRSAAILFIGEPPRDRAFIL
jgi:hypothetical protein